MFKLLDLFCGAGGCSEGYRRAGFSVVGVDSSPQKNYPFEFHQGDAIEFVARHGHEFDCVHASPPCQRYSSATKATGNPLSHPDLVGPTRDALVATGRLWVIENVPGAPLKEPTVLCGSMFGLPVQRHRLFESNFYTGRPCPCDHGLFTERFANTRRNNWHRPRRADFRVVQVHGHGDHKGDRELWQRAMGIDWMTMKEMAQAIPPAYAEWIGGYAILKLKSLAAAATEKT